MRNAASRLKNVVSRKDIIPYLTHFVVRDGTLYASDGHVSACVPFPSKDKFCVRAADFCAFLDKVPGELKLAVQENGHVKVSCGRFRATIPGLLDDVATFKPPDTFRCGIKHKFLQLLEAARPFISDNATQPWAACVHINGDDIEATNNVVLVKGKGTGFPKGTQLLIPFQLVDYVLANPAGVLHATWDAQGLVAFHWKDTSWVVGRVPAVQYPNIGSIFASLPPAKWEVPDEWRGAAQQIIKLSDGEISLQASKIVAVQNGTELEADTSCPIPEGRDQTNWDGRYVSPVIDNATHITFYMQDGPRMSFKTELLHGVAVGMGK